MQKEDLEFFLGRNVKLELKTFFALYGEILKVSDDCLIFKTRQKTSIIRFEDIASVLEW